ncbi:MAG: hypothetical protein ACRC6V_06635 [Bacteroidales bacterium]
MIATVIAGVCLIGYLQKDKNYKNLWNKYRKSCEENWELRARLRIINGASWETASGLIFRLEAGTVYHLADGEWKDFGPECEYDWDKIIEDLSRGWFNFVEKDNEIRDRVSYIG